MAPTGLKSAGLKAWGWPVAAAFAAGFIGLLAFRGERPEPGLARFAPAGLLADWPAGGVVWIEVGSATYHRSFERDPAGGWGPQTGGSESAAELTRRIETGLQLLRNSPPQRTDLESEQLAEFGLAPPHLTVTLRSTDGASITVEFGGANPLGLERYARIAARNGILLIPSFVAEAWQPLAETR